MNVSELKKYKDGLYNSLCRDISEFEKNFLLIAAGLLAFSITFIKDIIKLDNADWLPVLFIHWGLIIASIAVMMNSFLWSANFSDQIWNTVDTFLKENHLYKDDQIIDYEQYCSVKERIDQVFHPKKRSLRNQRKVAVWLFIAGVIVLSFFVSGNILREKKTTLSTNVRKVETAKYNDFNISITDSTILIKKK